MTRMEGMNRDTDESTRMNNDPISTPYKVNEFSFISKTRRGTSQYQIEDSKIE